MHLHSQAYKKVKVHLNLFINLRVSLTCPHNIDVWRELNLHDIAQWQLQYSLHYSLHISASLVHSSVPLLSNGLEVIKLKYSLKLQIRCKDWLLVDTCPQAANPYALF